MLSESGTSLRSSKAAETCGTDPRHHSPRSRVTRDRTLSHCFICHTPQYSVVLSQSAWHKYSLTTRGLLHCCPSHVQRRESDRPLICHTPHQWHTYQV